MQISSLIRAAIGICPAVVILAACGAPLGPVPLQQNGSAGGHAAMPLTLQRPGPMLGSPDSVSGCPKVFVVEPALGFKHRGTHLLLKDWLLTLKRGGLYHQCIIIVSKKPLPAHWSASGGSLHVLSGKARAEFSSFRLGTYTVKAASGTYTAEAAVVVQLNNEALLASIGGHPNGALLADRGALYGVTYSGGTYGNGSVFKLAGGNTDTIHNFKGGADDGAFPDGALIADKKGDLFGTTPCGGIGYSNCGQGTVYELIPSGSGYTERILYKFKGGKQGAEPTGGLVADHSGALFGTTSAYNGTVFKLTPNGSGYTFRVLHRNNGGSDGAGPSALIISADGSLYGANGGGGLSCGCGTVFRLTPSGSVYVFSVLYRFKGGKDGSDPGGVIAGKAGSLYGTAAGGSLGNGIVFELQPSGRGFTTHVLYNFRGGADGQGPTGVVFGSQGALYGATASGGTGGAGTVFALTPNGAKYKETLLHTFEGAPDDGYTPNAGLIVNIAGALLGVTELGGASQDDGTVFRVNP